MFHNLFILFILCIDEYLIYYILIFIRFDFYVYAYLLYKYLLEFLLKVAISLVRKTVTLNLKIARTVNKGPSLTNNIEITLTIHNSIVKIYEYYDI